MNGTIGKTVLSYGVGGRSCVGKELVGNGLSKWNIPEDEIIRQKHYQWVIPILTLQAILLFFPRVIWHSLEGGLMERLLERTGELVAVLSEGYVDV